MPFRRHLTREFVETLQTNPFWINACHDRQLQPEIRNNEVTIYFCGQALVRELRCRSGVLSASVHHKFIPLQRVNPPVYLPVHWNGADGFAFNEQLRAEPLQQGNPQTLKAYKRLMKFEAGPEDRLQQKIITQPQNLVIDQQIEFRLAGSTNKIDLCYYDPSIKKIVFAEIKRKDDLRLSGPGDVPEVISQLHAYSQSIHHEQQAILDGLTEVIRLKRALGLQDRLNGIPEEGQGLQLERKPLLIIGNCTDQEVRQITHAGRHREIPSPWSPLWNHLEQAACGLIVCGPNGCRLSVRGGGGQRWWFGN